MRNVRLIALCAVLTATVAYATAQTPGPRTAWHGFEFNTYNSGVEMLDWSYGDPRFSMYHTPAGYQHEAHIPQHDSAIGNIPVGDYFYAKWKVNATGKIYEDKVDLKSRLPSNMDDKRLHFEIRNTQLYVFLIDDKEGHAPGAPDCPVKVYFDLNCTELYPENWTNFKH